MSASVASEVHAICMRARVASRTVAPLDRAQKDAALEAIAVSLREHRALILAENAKDVAEAAAAGTRGALLDRLGLDGARLDAVERAVREIQTLPDPVGTLIASEVRPNGLRVSRVRAPIGVIAMIYEARPNVTVEASALTLKAGNAVILRGGSEAIRSNAALARAIHAGLARANVSPDAVAVLPFTDRDAVRALVQESELVDLAIPRGGEALIRFVTENARVPVVQHYKGVCHLYLDAGVDLREARHIVLDAKLSRPGVCNALECLLVAASDAERLLPELGAALLAGGCEIRGDERTRALVPAAREAAENDWGREFLDRVLAVRVVAGLDEALAHVARYGSGHTEAICTKNADHAARWRREVDAACVVVNASTRFHDGGELGLGAEIGIATSRLHWRGPMGLESLTTMKWIVDGNGQTRG